MVSGCFTVGDFVEIGFAQECKNVQGFNISHNFVMTFVEMAGNFERSGDGNIIDDFNMGEYFWRRGISRDDL